MADPTLNFSYVYYVGLTPPNGTVTIQDNGGNGANNITVTDHYDGSGDSTSILGDIANDTVDWTSTYLSGKGVYQGTASNADSSGIIFYNPATQLYWYYTNSPQLVGATLDFSAAPDIICFMPGSLIRTPEGEVPVEALQRGDLVTTTDGRAMPVTWLGRQTISRLFADPVRVLPIRIKAGALANNVPSRDLLISPDHAVLVDGALVQAGALVNGTSVVRETKVPTVFTYYHVELDDHSLLLAENTPAETFVDNVDRLNFDNWAEHQALYPKGKTIGELPYPRAKAARQVPVAIRVRLAERAQVIGAVADVAAA